MAQTTTDNLGADYAPDPAIFFAQTSADEEQFLKFDAVLIAGTVSIRAQAPTLFCPPQARVPANYKDPAKIEAYIAKVSAEREQNISRIPVCLEVDQLLVAACGEVSIYGRPNIGAAVSRLMDAAFTQRKLIYGLQSKLLFSTLCFQVLRSGGAVPAAALSSQIDIADPLRRLCTLHPDIAPERVIVDAGFSEALAQAYVAERVLFAPLPRQADWLHEVAEKLPPDIRLSE